MIREGLSFRDTKGSEFFGDLSFRDTRGSEFSWSEALSFRHTGLLLHFLNVFCASMIQDQGHLHQVKFPHRLLQILPTAKRRKVPPQRRKKITEQAAKNGK